MKLVSCSDWSHDQVDVSESMGVGVVDSKAFTSIRCLVNLSPGMPTASRTDKEIIFTDDLGSSMALYAQLH